MAPGTVGNVQTRHANVGGVSVPLLHTSVVVGVRYDPAAHDGTHVVPFVMLPPSPHDVARATTGSTHGARHRGIGVHGGPHCTV